MNDDDKFEITWTEATGKTHRRIVERNNLAELYREIASQGGRLGGVVKQR